MSDTSGQEPAASAAVASQTSVGDTSRLRRWERLEFVARILATAGALLFAVGAWMPWVVVTGWALVGDQRQSYTLALSPGDVKLVFGSFAWGALSVVPLLVLPLAWWQLQERHTQEFISIIIIWLNTVWVTTIGISAPTELYYGNDVWLVPELHPQYLIITHHGQWLPGFWIANAGVVLIVLSAFLSLIVLILRPKQYWSLLRAGVQPANTPSRPRVALPGASALTIGLALWTVSTFVMPWASVNCSTTPLFAGTCIGLPYSNVLQLGIADVTTLIDPMVARYAVGVLLGGGAAMILAGLWLRARSLAFCGWTTLWLLLAAAFAWLAEDGVGVVVEKHAALGLPAGAWVGENAVLVTLLGFALALGGLVYLWVDAVRHRHSEDAH